MRRAFTLIELLVVIAIIAILAAILFPVFAAAKKSGKKTVSLSNLKQVSTASILYAGDYDDTSVPLYHYSPGDLSLPTTQGFYYWPVLLLPYTKSEAVFLCPEDRDDDRIVGDGTYGRFDLRSTYHLYAVGFAPSYGYNYRYLNIRTDLAAPGPNGLPFYYGGVSLTFAAAPAETVQFAESTAKNLTPPGSPGPITSTMGYSRIEPPSRWNASVSYPDARSQGQLWGRFDPKTVIVGWLDGHAKVRAIQALRGPAASVDQYWNGGPIN
jgi:prepilin-type N-terminal cleavage/methylation domain-containing protein